MIGLVGECTHLFEDHGFALLPGDDVQLGIRLCGRGWALSDSGKGAHAKDTQDGG